MPIQAEFTHIYDTGSWWVNNVNDEHVFRALPENDSYKRLILPHFSTYDAPNYVSTPDRLNELSLPTNSDGKISYFDEMKYRNRECWELDK